MRVLNITLKLFRGGPTKAKNFKNDLSKQKVFTNAMNISE